MFWLKSRVEGLELEHSVSIHLSPLFLGLIYKNNVCFYQSKIIPFNITSYHYRRDGQYNTNMPLMGKKNPHFSLQGKQFQLNVLGQS